jgi:dolichol-phosphate mannosyltransferase
MPTLSPLTADPLSICAHPEISIVIPVYNELGNVAHLVKQLDKALAGRQWEALFVDDDSPDGTADEVRRICLDDPRIRLILRIEDAGLAKACIQGMLSAKADLLCIMDGDGQHDPVYIPELMAALDQSHADLASAARVNNDAMDPATLGATRQRLSGIGNALVRKVTGRQTRDTLTGFFLIRREAFLSVARRLSNSGFKLLFDILASNHALRHVEIPFNFKERHAGDSKLDAHVLWQFLSLAIEKLCQGWIPARVISFLAVGSLGLIVHMAVLFSALALGVDFQYAQGSAAIVAMTFNFGLNNMLAFRDRRFHGRGLIAGWAGYFLTCSVSLLANVILATWTYQRLEGMILIAALAGISVDVVWKFIVSDRLLWRKKQRKFATAKPTDSYNAQR